MPKGKPPPDLFRRVANEFKVDPADCIVVEDSIAGVTAAKTAGCGPSDSLAAAPRRATLHINF